MSVYKDHTAVRALELAVQSSLQGEGAQSVAQRAKVYYGFLLNPEGTEKLSPGPAGSDEKKLESIFDAALR